VSTPPIILVPGFWLGPKELADIIGGIAKGASEP
jgi:hypothetical protein